MTTNPSITHVAHLPDLMTWDDYENADRKKLVRFRLKATDQGIEILGDSPFPDQLEKLLAALGPDAIEAMLCG